MNTKRNLSNRLHLKFSDHDDLLMHHNLRSRPTCSLSKINDSRNIDHNSQSKEEIIQNQKEAALRRMRQQFRTGIVIEPIHHNHQSFLSTHNDTGNNHQYSASSEIEPKHYVYNESRNQDLTSNVSLNQRMSNSAPDLEPNIHQRCTYKFAEDESSRYNTPAVFRSALQSCSVEDGVKDDTMNKSILNCTPKNPSLDPKEEMVLNKEMSSPNKDRIGLVRSPSTLSQIIQGNMNNESKSSRTFFSHDILEEDTDKMEDISSNILSDNFENVDWGNSAEVKKILMEPVPKEYGIVKCYVKRYRGKSRLCPEYRVYLDGSNQFLMTSKKRANKTTSNYLISIGRNDYSKSSCNIIGKLRANFLGTEFQIYDAGKNPKYLDSFFDEKNYDEPRSELGAVLYSSNIIGNRGPRKMQVCINRVSEHGHCVKRWQPAIKGEEMLECFKAKNEIARKHLLFYENRQPKWNEDIGSYVLNFDKRVSLASVKNFQLIDPASSNSNVLMQFGKKGQDEFIMDVRYPMSLFQAFAVSLSSCDSKLGVD